MGNCCGGSATVPSTSPTSPTRPVPAPTQETAPSTPTPTHPTSTPSPHVVWSSKGRPRMPAYDTAQHDYEMTTLSPKPERIQPQDSTSSQRRRDDEHDPPPSSGSDPHCQEIHSPPYQSRGGGSPQLHKSMSMDTTFPQRPRSHSSSRMTRTSPTYLLGHGPQSTGTQFESGLASATGQMPAEKQERRPHFPSTLQNLLSNDFRFRILVVGKPRSGKSSLISTIFNVDMSRAPTNVSGIAVEFRPRDNGHLIVHECSAFGPGELQAIRDFITTRNHKNRQVSERLHAIWICVPMSDVINGQFDEGLKLLLGTGVPLVIVFTMFDLIVPDVPSHGNEYERARAMAHMRWEAHCRTLFGNVRSEFVSTQPRFRDLIVKLVATTDGVIIGHSCNITASSGAQRTQPRLSPVTLAWSVSQRASRGINIRAAIEVGQTRYWCRLGSSDDFAGQTLANCVEVIHSDIVGVWNLPDKDRCLSSTAFKVGISHLIQDLSRPVGTSSRPRSSDTQGTGAAWLNERYENRNENIRLVVAYIVDLTLVLCDVFDCDDDVSPNGVQSVMKEFASSSPKTSIHAEIFRFLKTVHQFEYQDNDVVLTKIIDLIRQNCDSSFAHK